MPFCSKCGQKNQDSATRCETCGSYILGNTAQPPQVVYVEKPGCLSGCFGGCSKSFMSFILFILAIGFIGSLVGPPRETASTYSNPHEPSSNRAALPATLPTSAPAHSEKETAEKQNETTLKWSEDLQNKIKDFDTIWDVWKIVFNEMGSRRMDASAAYGHLQKMTPVLKELKADFYYLRAPGFFSEADKKTVSDAAEMLGTAAYCRECAVDKALLMLDDMKPSSLQAVKNEVESSNAYLLKGLGYVTTVFKNRGIEWTYPAQKSEKTSKKKNK